MQLGEIQFVSAGISLIAVDHGLSLCYWEKRIDNVFVTEGGDITSQA
jgi:hypothetical protein